MRSAHALAVIALVALFAPGAGEARSPPVLLIRLHPPRKAVGPGPSLAHREVELHGDGVALSGWLFPAQGTPLDVTVVYLHGIGDNRSSAVELAERLVPLGYDVLAYDSRAHGESSGAACTYGSREKRDLALVLEQLGIERAILVGSSLGAAVALQAAPDDPRIIGVFADASFADLRTVMRERAASSLTPRAIDATLKRAGTEGGFDVDDVSPLRAVERIRVPVLLVHGELDPMTSPEHARRLYAAVAGSKRLRLYAGVGHVVPLALVWGELDPWLARVSGAPAPALVPDALPVMSEAAPAPEPLGAGG
jgi:pimeloyl-ACP methyl ester carboxylesterase